MNNNKFYRMIPNMPKTGQFTAEYGRVGSKGMKKIYPMANWHYIYNDKTNKGYTDQSSLHQDFVCAIQSKYKPISDAVIDDLVNRLQSFANQALKKNYKVESKEVTQAMVDKARNIIASLSRASSVYYFNQLLLDLFATIPRKMSNVDDFLLKNMKDVADVISNEQNLLDVMAAKVTQNVKTSGESDYNITILEKMGMEVRLCTDEEIKNIKLHLGTESIPKYKRAYRIVNHETEERFNKYIKDNHLSNRDIHFLYHGSRNENFWGILTQGLKLNPNAVITGKMFGHGLYFAPRAKKSINYTSLNGSYWAKGSSDTGFLAVYKVAYKKPLDVYTHNSEYTTYTCKDMRRHGTDAMFAHKGSMLLNDEIIVYRENQATIRYLIELA